MKTTLALVAVLLSQIACFAQGQIIFNNRVLNANPAIDAPIMGYPNWWDGHDVVWGTPFLLEGTGYRAALLGGAVGSTPCSASSAGNLQMLASPTTGATWVTFKTGSLAGCVNVGVDGVRVVPGVNYGEMGVFQVVVWTGNYTSWSEAYSAGLAGLSSIAWSAPLTLRVSSSATDFNVPYLTGLGSFGVNVFVPEPASGVILGLGVMALMMIRRKDQKKDSK